MRLHHQQAQGSITPLVLQGDLLQAQSYRPQSSKGIPVSFQVRASRSRPQVSQEHLYRRAAEVKQHLVSTLHQEKWTCTSMVKKINWH
ncbi:Hypothetical protein FKW44_011281 [Caligus rogercresseyi]|uniref:Uncharacterized protein n=1 Tax=Caligus rogercresseyi TaxID=217165 RepID=A0A7T8HI51_CALRO|nr:Hypothetical protein FKW44_011281 [Caligus rogercresseyi]